MRATAEEEKVPLLHGTSLHLVMNLFDVIFNCLMSVVLSLAGGSSVRGCIVLSLLAIVRCSQVWLARAEALCYV